MTKGDKGEYKTNDDGINDTTMMKNKFLPFELQWQSKNLAPG